MFEPDAAALVDVIVAESRASAASDARKYAAIAELERLRNSGEHARSACDDTDAVAAEIAAALNIGHGRALGEIDLAVMLRNRLPKVAALFADGQINGRRVWLIEQRTRLVTDPEAVAAIDAAIAEHITAWGPLPEYKLIESLDLWVDSIDPGAVRRTRQSTRSRDLTIGGKDDDSGTTAIWGRLLSTDAAILKQRLDAMARSVCEGDPRTLPQRRADALGALGAGSQHLSCVCDDPACRAKIDDGRASSITIHVVTEQASTEAHPDPEFHGDEEVSSEAPKAQEPRPTPRRKAALIIGGGILPAPLLAELIARGAKLRPVAAPKPEPEPRYRPSAALDEFVRIRDLTCRYPGCDRRATHADIDHTVPYPAGATHPGNLKCYCRIHHLIKTFLPGWSDQQLADGTVVITTPTGHTYTTKPGASLHFPAWATPTPAPPPVPVEPAEHRGLMMPKRKRTRSQTRADRIKAERNKPPPF